MDLKSYFNKVWVINLDRRKDRWTEFQSHLSTVNWPFREPERWRASDGRLLSRPDWWKGAGGWGCLWSHMRIWEDAIHQGYERILVLEDDVVLFKGLGAVVAEHIQQLPHDWELWYPGGQILKGNREDYSENLEIGWDVNRTHAYALSKRGLPKVFKWCSDFRDDWRKWHIDHRLGQYQETRGITSYVSKPRLAGQSSSVSDIKGGTKPPEKWFGPQYREQKGPNASVVVESEDPKGVAVIGPWGSGSSAVAGVLHHLGVHMGNKFLHLGPREGSKQRNTYEAVGLRDALTTVCVEAGQGPEETWWTLRTSTDEAAKELGEWGGRRKGEARKRGKSHYGGKHCLLAVPQIYKIIHQRWSPLRVVKVVRDPEAIMATMDRRHWRGKGEKALNQILTFMKGIPDDVVVRYEELLKDPDTEVRRIAKELKLSPNPTQFAAAIQSVIR